MLLKRALTVSLVLLLLGMPSSADAGLGDILGYPLRWLGGQLVKGGVDKLKGTISDVDARAKEHELRISTLANAFVSNTKDKVDDSVDRVDHALEARILQVKTGLDDTADRALTHFNSDLRARLIQADGVAQRFVSAIDTTLKTSLDHADAIIRERSADIALKADDLITHADQALELRIAQLDEVAGRRLGNVDVIATKQRIAFEQSGIRIAVLVGLIVFVVFVLKNVWSRYTALLWELEGVRGAQRTVLLARKLAPGVFWPLLAAASSAAVLVALYRWLPMGAVHEAEQLQALHASELDAAVARLDYPRARFHASQIELLDPEQAAAAAAKADKTALLRDLIARPALLGTRESVAAFTARVRAVEAGLGPRPDPDVLMLNAILRWETGQTRADEHAAASLAARALRLSRRQFALAPLARVYVQTFLDAPYVPARTGIGRDALSLDELEEAIAAPLVEASGSPFMPLVSLSSLMRALVRESTNHYVKMVEAHAKIAVYGPTKDDLAVRAQHARAIVEAWRAFDESLQQTEGLIGPIVLNVFHLNDAVLTHAQWFLLHPDTTVGPKRLEDIGQSRPELEEKLLLAPARIIWARRYEALFRGPARPIVEFEEAERYRDLERWTIELEQAMVARAAAAKEKKPEDAARWRVGVAASALALYVDDGDRRVAYAAKVGAPERAPLPVAPLAPLTKPARGRAAQPVEIALAPQTVNVPLTLEEALLVRGPRLL